MLELPQAFKTRMKAMLGAEYPDFLAAYGLPPARGLRVNTLKISRAKFLEISPFPLVPSGVAGEGFVLAAAPAGEGKHPYHAAGLYYLQEPSAMCAAAIADIRPGMKVLDMCAAPGGKATAAAASLSGEGFLLANEFVPSRAKVLAGNIERMGAMNAAVTSAAPDAVAAAFPEYFDRVIVDAPCSGEGMFRKDAVAVREWSEAHVLSCAERQKAILAAAAKCVAGGGALIYSTCTFSFEENEGAVEDFLAKHADFSLENAVRLYPHTSLGEGHFAARFVRTGGGRGEQGTLSLCAAGARAVDFIEDNFTDMPGTLYELGDGRTVLLQAPLPEGLSRLRVLSAGVPAGEMAKGRFEPAHALFMAAGARPRRALNMHLGDARLPAFLRGESVLHDGPGGFTSAAVDGYSLGFGKAVDGMLKNRLPKGLRLMG